MSEEKRLNRAYSFFYPIMRFLVRRKFNYSFDSLKEIPGPYLLLANHNTDWDPIMVGLANGKRLRFVATEHILRKKFAAWFLTRYFKPIVHMKGKLGTRSTMEILRALRHEESVCIFAEGNRSFYGVTGEIPEVTGKLAKKSGVSLVTFRFEGGYFTQPRWGKSFRKGRLHGSLVRVYSPEELSKMSDTDVQRAICEDLHEDAYRRQDMNPVAFKGKNTAEGMEVALYCCPKCKSFSSLHSRGKHISCACGFSAEYDDFGNLTDEEHTVYTLSDLADEQRTYLRSMVFSGKKEALFSDTVTVGEVLDHKVPDTEEKTLTAYTDRFQIEQKEITLKNIAGAAIFSRNTLLIHMEDPEGIRQYEVKGSESFSAIKYLDLWNLLKERQEEKNENQ